MSNNQSSITFPYATLDAAIQDKFAKIGGPTEAFRLLSHGYKSIIWHKRSNQKNRVTMKELKAQIEAYEKRLEEQKRLAEAAKQPTLRK